MRERLAESVRRAVHHSGGRPVPADQLHLTLAFLGAVPVAQVTALADLAMAAQHAARLPGTTLEISLGRLEYWTRPRVLCALPLAPPAGLGRLVSGLLEGLTAAGFTPDLKPFRAHVTVARKVACLSEPHAMHPVRWRFEHFALVESRTQHAGAVYSVVETYPLCGGASVRK